MPLDQFFNVDISRTLAALSQLGRTIADCTHIMAPDTQLPLYAHSAGTRFPWTFVPTNNIGSDPLRSHSRRQKGP